MNEMNNEVKIVNYEPQYKEAFKALNEEWIKTFFTMEAGDYKLLENPEEYIINEGGHIVFAIMNNEAVGTCALVKISDEPLRFELSKMAVSPKAQGKKIGYLVGKALVDKAKQLKAKSIFLETNSVLVPAIKLYEKLGFKHMPISNSAYARCDTQMLLEFND